MRQPLLLYKLPDIAHVFRQQLSAVRFQKGASSEAPAGADAGNACIAGGVEVSIRITDIDSACRLSL